MPLLHAAFIITVLCILWSVYKLHQIPDNNFNMIDLLMEGGRVSKVACILMGSFFVHSWIMVDLQAHDKMSEGYLTIYGATWVAPMLARLFLTKGAPTNHAKRR
jgi:hypothetical protein